MKAFFFKTILLFVIFAASELSGQQRFPEPEFETGYTVPTIITPQARSAFLEYFDVLILIVALSVITWLILKKRSRKGVLLVSVFSLAYFGFYREGCVCSIGAIQNVVLALFDSSYTIPLTVVAFFLIPLLFTLFFGRTFCAGVCPLGAIQDLVIFRPMKINPWVARMLGMIPFIYLALAVLYAATSTDFIICRYDPFVGFFRMEATFMMFSIGGVFLLTGVFIARPYCRFFCPYSVLLNWMSQLSKFHLTITPSKCIQCRLCENACPFDAIEKPVSVEVIENRDQSIRRMMLTVVMIPVLIAIGTWAGYSFHENLALANPKVRLAQNLYLDASEIPEDVRIEIDAFKTLGQTPDALYGEAAMIIGRFKTGSMIMGGFLGLILGVLLLGLTRFYHRTDYVPNRGNCLSCGRCMDYCPVDRKTENTNRATEHAK